MKAPWGIVLMAATLMGSSYATADSSLASRACHGLTGRQSLICLDLINLEIESNMSSVIAEEGSSYIRTRHSVIASDGAMLSLLDDVVRQLGNHYSIPSASRIQLLDSANLTIYELILKIDKSLVRI